VRAVIAASLLIVLLTGCEEKVRPSVLNGVSGTQLPSQESWNSTITFSDSGIVKAVVRAGHIYAYDNSRTTFLESGVIVDFYDDVRQAYDQTDLTSRLGGRSNQ
jgi:hypothetical protein